MNEDVKPIKCNSPWERVPCCSCDPGHGPQPTALQMLECKMRGGPCRPSDEPQYADT